MLEVGASPRMKHPSEPESSQREEHAAEWRPALGAGADGAHLSWPDDRAELRILARPDENTLSQLWLHARK